MNNDTILNRFSNSREQQQRLGQALEMFTSASEDEEMQARQISSSNRLPGESILDWESRVRDIDKRATQSNLEGSRGIDNNSRQAALSMHEDFLREEMYEDSDSPSLFKTANLKYSDGDGVVQVVKIDSNMWR